MYLCMYMCVYVYVCVCVCICVHENVCVCVYVCVRCAPVVLSQKKGSRVVQLLETLCLPVCVCDTVWEYVVLFCSNNLNHFQNLFPLL